jgi:hypothetical protein
MTALGNAFTVPRPFAVEGKLLEVETRHAAREALDLRVPQLPGTPRISSDRVFEAAGATNGAGVQQAIDAAAAFALDRPGSRPVVHLPRGECPVTGTLTLPAGCSNRRSESVARQSAASRAAGPVR